MDTPATNPAEQARAEEYDRWYARGQKCKGDGDNIRDSILRNMKPGSNAYEAFADGFAAGPSAEPEE